MSCCSFKKHVHSFEIHHFQHGWLQEVQIFGWLQEEQTNMYIYIYVNKNYTKKKLPSQVRNSKFSISKLVFRRTPFSFWVFISFNQLAESDHVLKLGWVGIIARLNIPKLQAVLGSQRINKQLDCIYAYHTILPMQMVQYTNMSCFYVLHWSNVRSMHLKQAVHPI